MERLRLQRKDVLGQAGKRLWDFWVSQPSFVESRQKAGMCYDAEDVKSLGLLLSWLRKWRKGDFSRAEADRKAGGVEERRKAWLWGEDLWLGALDEEACEFGVAMKAGGRSKSPRATEAEIGRAHV